MSNGLDFVSSPFCGLLSSGLGAFGSSTGVNCLSSTSAKTQGRFDNDINDKKSPGRLN